MPPKMSDTYAQDIDMTMTMSGELEGEQAEIGMLMNTHGIVQPNDEKMQLATSFTISVQTQIPALWHRR